MIIKLIRKILSLFGLGVYSLRPLKGIGLYLLSSEKFKNIHSIWEDTKKDKKTWLQEMGIQSVLDIGANEGGFAGQILKILPNIELYSFEPVRECFRKLTELYNNNPNVKTFNIALGSQSGESIIYRNDFSPSSSLLPMAKLHKENFPYTKDAKEERIKIARLDDIAKQLDLKKPFLVKIDVQGFENEVIKGGKETLREADIIIVEMSIKELYVEQPLFHTIYSELIVLGFEFKGCYDQLYSPVNGEILQVDGIFQKSTMKI